MQYFIPCTKRNSEWTLDINVRPETTELLEENIDVVTSGKDFSATAFSLKMKHVEFLLRRGGSESDQYP